MDYQASQPNQASQANQASMGIINKVDEVTNNNKEAQGFLTSKCRKNIIPLQVTKAASYMDACLPSAICNHLLPLFKAQSGSYQVLVAPLINPDGGKIVRKSQNKYIRFVTKENRLNKLGLRCARLNTACNSYLLAIRFC